MVLIRMLILLGAILAIAVLKGIFQFRLRDVWLRYLAPLHCRFRPHRRSRRRVRKIGDSYTSECQFCGAPMMKDGRDGEWLPAHGQPDRYAAQITR